MIDYQINVVSFVESNWGKIGALNFHGWSEIIAVGF